MSINQFLIAADILLFVVMCANIIRMRQLSSKLKTQKIRVKN